jgi:hypothetical protein
MTLILKVPFMNGVKKASLFCCLLLASLSSLGQVSNNSIHNRSELALDVLTPSSTANNTVEWDCINKSLTQKCLVYHNDQWFHFTPEKNGKLYLNISAQACRDLRGVQMIVIEGNPCEIQTYRILKCIPKIFQDDVFVELDSLKAKTLYLVNVDGYLGDFCKFNLELSETPKGLPVAAGNNKLIKLNGTIEDETVVLNWYASQSQFDSIGSFEIYRHKKNDIKSTLLINVNVYSNTLGNRNENYVYTDTLHRDGEYHYRIIGVSKATKSKTLLDEVMVDFQPERDYTVRVPLSFSKKGTLAIAILDPDNNNRILNISEYEYFQPGTLPVVLTEYAQMGIKRFWIKIRNEKTKEGRLFGYYIDELSRLQSIDK